MTAWLLVIPGAPVPCGRPRFSSGGHAYMPERTRAYERKVREMAKAVFPEPIGTRVRLQMVFLLPDRRRRDLDNLAKSVMDGLNGVAFSDDSQVCVTVASKFVSTSSPMAIVRVDDGFSETLDRSAALWRVVES